MQYQVTNYANIVVQTGTVATANAAAITVPAGGNAIIQSITDCSVSLAPVATATIATVNGGMIANSGQLNIRTAVNGANIYNYGPSATVTINAPTPAATTTVYVVAMSTATAVVTGNGYYAAAGYDGLVKAMGTSGTAYASIGGSLKATGAPTSLYMNGYYSAYLELYDGVSNTAVVGYSAVATVRLSPRYIMKRQADDGQVGGTDNTLTVNSAGTGTVLAGATATFNSAATGYVRSGVGLVRVESVATVSMGMLILFGRDP